MSRTLTGVAFDQIVVIENVVGDPLLTRRLREVGFHRGCPVRVVGRAPFRGPWLVELHGSVLALRADEAECLRIA